MWFMLQIDVNCSEVDQNHQSFHRHHRQSRRCHQHAWIPKTSMPPASPTWNGTTTKRTVVCDGDVDVATVILLYFTDYLWCQEVHFPERQLVFCDGKYFRLRDMAAYRANASTRYLGRKRGGWQAEAQEKQRRKQWHQQSYHKDDSCQT